MKFDTGGRTGRDPPALQSRQAYALWPDTAPPQKDHNVEFRMKKLFVKFIVIILAVALIFSAVTLVRYRKAQLASLSAPHPHPIAVFYKSGNWGTLAITRHYLGTIEPESEAVLSAQTTGYITVLYKDVGDRLQKGETAARIDNRLSEARRNALVEELVGAREDLETKQTIRDRRRELFLDRAVSREALDESELAANLAKSRVRRLEQEKSAATVSLSFSLLQSLFGGIVTERMRSIGDLVTTGSPVLRIENPDQGYKILVRVPQETAAILSHTTPVRLLQGDRVIESTIDRIHPAILSGNLATVEIKSPARPFNLPSRGVVGVDLTVAEPEGWIVDEDCLLETGAKTLVFPLTDDRTVSPIVVTVRGRVRSRAVVEGPLTAKMSLAAGPESMLLTLGPGVHVLPVSAGDP